jgi:hypothetical protein
LKRADCTTAEPAGCSDDSVSLRIDQALTHLDADGLAVTERALAPDPSDPRTLDDANSSVEALSRSPSSVLLAAVQRTVGARYCGRNSAFQLQLCVALDDARPVKQVGGDFYLLSKAATAYAGSFVVDDPTLMVTPTAIKLRGLGSYTFTAGFPIVQVTIEHRLFGQASPAVVQFFSPTNTAGTTYICAYDSP